MINERKLPDVQVGQVWVDNDARQEGKREVKVLGLSKQERSKKDPVWVCQVFIGGEDTKRTTKVRQSRFRPTSTGYRLKGADEKKPLSIREKLQQARVAEGGEPPVKVEVVIPTKEESVGPAFNHDSES